MNYLVARNIYQIIFGLILVVTPWCAQAVKWSPPNAAELAVLPSYCKAKTMPNTPLYDQWHRSLGRIFLSIHHYCAALNFVNRYYATLGRERDTWLHFALDDFNYMIKHYPNGYPLVPSIYVNRGSALHLAGRDLDAMQDYNSALKLNPKLRGAYLGLIGLLSEKKQNEEAIKIATQGLKNLPEDKALQERYIELGGKLPYPKPLESTKQELDTQRQDSSNNEETPQNHESSLSNDSNPAGEKTPSNTNMDKTGSPTNPWCRFCPPE